MDEPNYYKKSFEFSISTLKNELKREKQKDGLVSTTTSHEIIEIENAKDLILKFYPQFPFAKGNTYSIYYHKYTQKLTFVRKASKWFRFKSALKLIFVYIPLCFKHGYPIVNSIVKQIYKESWIVSEAFEEDKYNSISEYIEKKKNGVK